MVGPKDVGTVFIIIIIIIIILFLRSHKNYVSDIVSVPTVPVLL